MKKKSLFIFALILSFAILFPSNYAFAQGTYELHNDLSYPVTVDLYRVYWEKDLETKPVYIETIKLNPDQKHTCDFTKTNDQDIKSYQYRIQLKTKYFVKGIEQVLDKQRTTISSIIKSDNECIGWYKVPSFF